MPSGWAADVVVDGSMPCDVSFVAIASFTRYPLSRTRLSRGNTTICVNYHCNLCQMRNPLLSKRSVNYVRLIIRPLMVCLFLLVFSLGSL